MGAIGQAQRQAVRAKEEHSKTQNKMNAALSSMEHAVPALLVNGAALVLAIDTPSWQIAGLAKER